MPNFVVLAGNGWFVFDIPKIEDNVRLPKAGISEESGQDPSELVHFVEKRLYDSGYGRLVLQELANSEPSRGYQLYRHYYQFLAHQVNMMRHGKGLPPTSLVAEYDSSHVKKNSTKPTTGSFQNGSSDGVSPPSSLMMGPPILPNSSPMLIQATKDPRTGQIYYTPLAAAGAPYMMRPTHPLTNHGVRNGASVGAPPMGFVTTGTTHPNGASATTLHSHLLSSSSQQSPQVMSPCLDSHSTGTGDSEEDTLSNSPQSSVGDDVEAAQNLVFLYSPANRNRKRLAKQREKRRQRRQVCGPYPSSTPYSDTIGGRPSP